MRVSNLPTIWSNCLIGAALGARTAAVDVVSVTPLLMALGACTALYTAGMVLNDWFDREVDARERPARPLPSGRISPRAALAVGNGLLIGGIALVASLDPWAIGCAAVLALMILTYDAWHTRSLVFVVVLGLCRALVYWLSAACQGPLAIDRGALLVVPLILAAYVVLLSVVARNELTLDGKPGRAPLLLATACPGIGWVVLFATGGGRFGVVALIALALALGSSTWILWTGAALQRRRIPVVSGVQRLLAGICLLDAGFLMQLGYAWLAVAALAGWGLTLAFQRRISGS